MTTPEPEIEVDEDPEIPEMTPGDEMRRRMLLFLLTGLVIATIGVGVVFARYILKPQPLPEMLIPPSLGSCSEPGYKFSINNIDGPVSVAVSPDNQRVYAAESGEDRMVKMYDRDGNLVTNFAPPGTDKANREPKYMAVGPDGRVYLVDRTSSAIDIYDQDGNFIDAIIGQQMTLSKYVASHIGMSVKGITFAHYDGISHKLTYQLPGQVSKNIIVNFADDEAQWGPLGLRFDASGDLLYTDTTSGLHSIHIIPAADLKNPLSSFAPVIKEFGAQGTGNSQFDFPQSVVIDGTGNYYVSDGNNSRISVWTPDLKYKTFFGYGTAEGALNLPRGLWLVRNCLYVADAVGAVIRVYDVSGTEPSFAYEIGSFGLTEGKFNYPVDIAIDGTGRLYIADRANNRIQVWSH
ncbi:MAG: NHL repeat-containing protein [Chloroflexota bacterium]